MHRETRQALGKVMLIEEQMLAGVSDYQERSSHDAMTMTGGDEAIAIRTGIREEDFERTDVLALFLPPGSVAGLNGYLGLQLRACGVNGEARLQAAWMRAPKSCPGIGLLLENTSPVSYDWIYSREPKVITVLRPECGDYNELCEFGWFRRTTLAEQSATLASNRAPSEILIEVTDQIAKAAEKADLCEILFQAMAARFSRESVWRFDDIQDQAIQTVIADTQRGLGRHRDAGVRFHVIIDDGVTERVIGKSQTPILRFPATGADGFGSPRSFLIGISVDA